MADMGRRPDGSEKGLGYFGKLTRPGGGYSTELSVGVNMNGEEKLIPLLTPNLSQQEIAHLLNGGKPTDEIMNKAVSHARERLSAGKSPFANEGEQTRRGTMTNPNKFMQAVSGGGMTGPPQAGTGTTPGQNPISQAMQNTESQGGKISDLLNDQNFQMFLAELGTQFGKGGFGEMVGEPTQNFIQRDALSKALSDGANINFGADGSMKIQQNTSGQKSQEKDTEPSTDNALAESGADNSESDSYSLFDKIADNIMGE